MMEQGDDAGNDKGAETGLGLAFDDDAITGKQRDGCHHRLVTILWLIAIRREGLNVSGWQFLKVAIVVMPISLLMAIGSAILCSPR